MKDTRGIKMAVTLLIIFDQGSTSWGKYLSFGYYGKGVDPPLPPSQGPRYMQTYNTGGRDEGGRDGEGGRGGGGEHQGRPPPWTPNTQGGHHMGLPSYSPEGERRPKIPWGPNSSGPIFDPSPPQNVTAMKNDRAFLHCIVHNIGNKTVSWIREADLHILTVAQYTYTADGRFEVIHSPDGNTSSSWILKINSVQPRDSGRYDCQVNTHPTDPITFPVYLSVFVPTAHVLGSTERYVDRGSTINLTCIINHNPPTQSQIFWYHNNKVINYDNRDSRVSVITDRGVVTKTILLIHDAHDAATGTYSCAPSPSATASVRIHILNGEMPAAMQTNTAINILSNSCIQRYIIIPLQLHNFFSHHSIATAVAVVLSCLFSFYAS